MPINALYSCCTERYHYLMSTRSVFLISKWLDPIFALGVGIWAYGLYEREHPRPEGHKLQELIQRRYNMYYKEDKDIGQSST